MVASLSPALHLLQHRPDGLICNPRSAIVWQSTLLSQLTCLNPLMFTWWVARKVLSSPVFNEICFPWLLPLFTPSWPFAHPLNMDKNVLTFETSNLMLRLSRPSLTAPLTILSPDIENFWQITISYASPCWELPRNSDTIVSPLQNCSSNTRELAQAKRMHARWEIAYTKGDRAV